MKTLGGWEKVRIFFFLFQTKKRKIPQSGDLPWISSYVLIITYKIILILTIILSLIITIILDRVTGHREPMTLSSYFLTFSSSSNFQKHPGRTNDFEKESILLLWMREAFGRRKLEVKGTSFSIIRWTKGQNQSNVKSILLQENGGRWIQQHLRGLRRGYKPACSEGLSEILF